MAEDHSKWRRTSEQLQNDTPSRLDGIDLPYENYLRFSYCTFLQSLGMALRVPQVTIATAMVYCHRFFLYHSLLKNDRYMIATVCMFVAAKVEDTHRLMEDVLWQARKLIRVKNKEGLFLNECWTDEELAGFKEKLLTGETFLLASLGFDTAVVHPYEFAVTVTGNLGLSSQTKKDFDQIAQNFVNDGWVNQFLVPFLVWPHIADSVTSLCSALRFRTSICLQFSPEEVWAGVILLTSQFLKVSLPCGWYRTLHVSLPVMLEVCDQLLDLYEHHKDENVLKPTESEQDTLSHSFSNVSAYSSLDSPFNDQESAPSEDGKLMTSDGVKDMDDGDDEEGLFRDTDADSGHDHSSDDYRRKRKGNDHNDNAFTHRKHPR